MNWPASERTYSFGEAVTQFCPETDTPETAEQYISVAKNLSKSHDMKQLLKAFEHFKLGINLAYEANHEQGHEYYNDVLEFIDKISKAYITERQLVPPGQNTDALGNISKANALFELSIKINDFIQQKHQEMMPETTISAKEEPIR